MKSLSLKTEKTVLVGKAPSYVFCSGEMQGWRPQMEDKSIKCADMGDGNSLFAIFDGHGGKQISQFLQKMFIKQLLQLKAYQEGHYEEALIDCFKILDEKISTDTGSKVETINGKQLELAVCILSGSTANVVLITPTHMYIANCGDSRSSLMRNGITIELSTDHKPECEEELARIVKAGGNINNKRVNGNLNLTRAFGDFMYKSNKELSFQQQIITCLPDIKVIARTSKDEFILMGCDGIWQRYEGSSRGLMEIIAADLKMGRKISDILTDMLDLLVSRDIIESKGKGCDNMSAILIVFN